MRDRTTSTGDERPTTQKGIALAEEDHRQITGGGTPTAAGLGNGLLGELAATVVAPS